MSSIFISHSHLDGDFVKWLSLKFEQENIKVWLYRTEIGIGESILSKISDGIVDTDYLAIILSPNSINSNWVKYELRIAMNLEINGRKLKVLPILYRACDIPIFLQDKRYVDFTDRSKYTNSFVELIRVFYPDAPLPEYMTAKEAALYAKTRFHPNGLLARISHVGSGSVWYVRLTPGMSTYDVKSGKSRGWCLEFYSYINSSVYVIGCLDGQWVNWTESINDGNGLNLSEESRKNFNAINFNYIDSDIAVDIARKQASLYSPLYINEDNFFVLMRLLPIYEYGICWSVSFYDVTLVPPTFIVLVHPETGAILFSGKEITR